MRLYKEESIMKLNFNRSYVNDHTKKMTDHETQIQSMIDDELQIQSTIDQTANEMSPISSC